MLASKTLDQWQYPAPSQKKVNDVVVPQSDQCGSTPKWSMWQYPKVSQSSNYTGKGSRKAEAKNKI